MREPATTAARVTLLFFVGALDVFVGVALVEHPEFTAEVLTLFLAVLLVFGGVYRFVASLWLRFRHYGWAAFSALVSIAVGIFLWMQWPVSVWWFIGLAVGINAIFAGIAWSSLSPELKNA